MAGVSKEMCEAWLARLNAGQHINSTSGEERQLVYAWLKLYGGTAPEEQANAAPKLADLIELAATWCQSAADTEGHAAVSNLWATRAKMLRNGYQPVLVRAEAGRTWEPVPQDGKEFSYVFEFVQTHDERTKAIFVVKDDGAMFKLTLPSLPQNGEQPKEKS